MHAWEPVFMSLSGLSFLLKSANLLTLAVEGRNNCTESKLFVHYICHYKSLIIYCMYQVSNDKRNYAVIMCCIEHFLSYTTVDPFIILSSITLKTIMGGISEYCLYIYKYISISLLPKTWSWFNPNYTQLTAGFAFAVKHVKTWKYQIRAHLKATPWWLPKWFNKYY